LEGSGVSLLLSCSAKSTGDSKSRESPSRSGRSLAKSSRASPNSEESEKSPWSEGEEGSESRIITGMGKEREISTRMQGEMKERVRKAR